MADSKSPTHIVLWCLPRTISTAITKCLSAIDGMEVYLELFAFSYMSAHLYKRERGEDLPMEYEGNEQEFAAAAEMLSNLIVSKIEGERISFPEVQKKLEKASAKYVLSKDMTYAVREEKTRAYIPSGYKHVFLLRHPVRTYTSYRKAGIKQLRLLGMVKEDVETFDLEVEDFVLPSSTFYKDMHSLWRHVRESSLYSEPIVLDVDDLLTNPAEVLPKFCRAVGLPYSESLLQWGASTDVANSWEAPGDTVAKDLTTFYETAMTSSCFLPLSALTPRDQLPADVIRLSDASMEFYEDMRKHIL